MSKLPNEQLQMRAKPETRGTARVVLALTGGAKPPPRSQLGRKAVSLLEKSLRPLESIGTTVC